MTMVAVRHDVQGHAHEEGIPGTVNLRAKEGEETHYGQALYPVPALDPNDPLQVCTEIIISAESLTKMRYSGRLGRRTPF